MVYMAEIIKETVASRVVSKYPWNEWFDGQPRKLTRGNDFTVSTVNFRSTVKAAAARRGINVVTSVRGDSVYIQAFRDAEA